MSASTPAQAVAARLGVAVHWVPALRERAADIAVLWTSFAAQRAPGLRLVLGDDARQALEAAGWVGNLAELRAVVEHVIASGRRGEVRVEDLPDGVRSKRAWSMIERTEMEAIRRAFPCPRLRVADRGLREGILVKMMRADGVWDRG